MYQGLLEDTPVPTGFRLTTDAGDGAKFRYEFGDIEDRELSSEWEGEGRILGFSFNSESTETKPMTRMIQLGVAYKEEWFKTEVDPKKYDFLGPVMGNVETFERTKLGENNAGKKGVANNRAEKRENSNPKYCKLERIKYCTTDSNQYAKHCSLRLFYKKERGCFT